MLTLAKVFSVYHLIVVLEQSIQLYLRAIFYNCPQIFDEGEPEVYHLYHFILSDKLIDNFYLKVKYSFGT